MDRAMIRSMSADGGQQGGGTGGSGGSGKGGGGGGARRGGGSGGGNRRRGPGGGGGGQRRGPGGAGGGGRGSGAGRGQNAGGGNQGPQPIEIAVRSTRNAIDRHAKGLRDDQTRLACRSLLVALHGNLDGVGNPGEALGLLEQVQHVLHATRRDDSQLPVALRAVVAFVTDTPSRQRDVQELVRLVLRHLYALCSDFMPRQPRDDGRFRASALLDVVQALSVEYLDDERFEQLRR